MNLIILIYCLIQHFIFIIFIFLVELGFRSYFRGSGSHDYSQEIHRAGLTSNFL